ncbi:unnamed protein product [Notodromas monacha]|uniref:Uncharacterized protein n=1 Tax=Notodromas monacha TaxID=399045 RepID=A0A7R9GKM0_9CRUS|nr:unnamed protein product [Notodromas monacha]CAG0924058.1 unnamed protein product [Notodromas monacha]
MQQQRRGTHFCDGRGEAKASKNDVVSSAVSTAVVIDTDTDSPATNAAAAAEVAAIVLESPKVQNIDTSRPSISNHIHESHNNNNKPRPFTCTHSLPTTKTPPSSSVVPPPPSSKRHACRKAPSEAFENYVDGSIEKDYPELAPKRHRHHHHRHHHHHHHHHHPQNQQNNRQKRGGIFGKCESTVTTSKQPDKLLQRWTEKLSLSKNGSNKSCSDILLTGSPSMQFADDAELDRLDTTTTTGTTTTTSRSEESDDVCEEEDDEDDDEDVDDEEGATTSGVRGSTTSSFLNFSSISSELLANNDDDGNALLIAEFLPRISVLPPTPQAFSPDSWNDVSDLHVGDGVEDDLVTAIDEEEFRGAASSSGSNDLNRRSADDTCCVDGYVIARFSTLADLHTSETEQLCKTEPGMRHSTSGELQTLTAVRFLSNRVLLTKRSMSLDTFHIVSKKWPGTTSTAATSNGDDEELRNDGEKKRKNNFHAEFLRSACGTKHTLSRWLEGKLPSGFPRTNSHFQRNSAKHYLSPDTCKYMANPAKKNGDNNLDETKDEGGIKSNTAVDKDEFDGKTDINDLTAQASEMKGSENKTAVVQQTPKIHKKKGFVSFFWHRDSKKSASNKQTNPKEDSGALYEYASEPRLRIRKLMTKEFISADSGSL